MIRDALHYAFPETMISDIIRDSSQEDSGQIQPDDPDSTDSTFLRYGYPYREPFDDERRKEKITMEETAMRELSLEEMDKVSGGIHGREENRRAFFVFFCPYCNEVFSSYRDRMLHIRDSHQEQSN